MKKNISKSTMVIIFLFALGIWIRAYHFPERIFFTLEQGITLQTTYDYFHGHFSLLGLANVQRFTSTGLRIFSGPLYNYALIPVMFMLGTNPITLTYFALVTNIFTALMLYILVKDLSGQKVAFFTTLFFLFSFTMIMQSLTLWILNPLPLVGLLGMYLLIKYQSKYTSVSIFLLGILSGIAISLEWMSLITIFAVGAYLFIKSKQKFRDGLFFIFGITIPLIPTVIFDARHDWYHIRTLWQYALDTISNPGQGKPRLYHLFHLFPLWFYILGLCTAWITKNKYYLAILISGLYIIYGSAKALRTYPIVNTPTLLEIGMKIDSIAKPNYNVVYMPEAEYRAYALRYILTVLHDNPPMAIDAYPSSSELYVVATNDRDMDLDIPWEINIFQPKLRELVFTSEDNKVLLYKLTK